MRVWAGRLFLSAPIVFLVATACGGSSGGGGGVSCADGGLCPFGQQCSSGVCVSAGNGGSGGSGFGGSGGSGFGGSALGGNGGSGFGGSGGSGFGGSAGTGGAGTGGSGFGGSGGSGFGGTGGVSSGQLGRACSTNAECGAGLFCATSSSSLFDGGGPPKGLCTVECTTDATICANHDPSSVCLEYSTGNAYCMQGCSFGPPGQTQFSPFKCHGRQELACSPLFSDSGIPCNAGQCGANQICNAGTCFEVHPACLPRCNSDQDCAGLHCAPASGVCTSTAKAGKPVGAVCTQSTGGTSDCKGNCVGFVHPGESTPFTYMCAEQCTLGAFPSCGWEGPASGAAPGACLFVSTVIGNGGYGDAASCGQLCDCNSDCLNPALVCESFGDAQLESFYQKNGFCSDPLGEGGAPSQGIPCP